MLHNAVCSTLHYNPEIQDAPVATYPKFIPVSYLFHSKFRNVNCGSGESFLRRAWPRMAIINLPFCPDFLSANEPGYGLLPIFTK